MISKCAVYVVDDSPQIVDIACQYLRGNQIECLGFLSPNRLLSKFVPGSVDCVVTDLKMPDMDGEHLLRQLRRIDPLTSIVIVTAFADVPKAVQLMEQGAYSLLEKPFTEGQFISIVQRAVRHARAARSQSGNLIEAVDRLSTLTEDEREVMRCMIAGLQNKEIVDKLILSPRTLDRRRKSVLEKMNVSSVVELVALTTRLETQGMLAEEPTAHGGV